ncbi:MAG TPA: tetratricopeptide repeat protein [Streptosporangiaceae bacterium]|nr:tetratricopeptide repeat protein [Streptosporangiaceae bacterium]
MADEDPFVSAIGRAIRGQVMLNFGTDLDQAEEDFRLGYAGFAGIGERWGMAMALDGLATMADRRGDFKAAIAHHVRAIELTAELGTIEDEGQFRVYLARELWLDGQRDQAAIELDRALRQADRIGWPESQALAAYTAGELARHDGQLDVAAAPGVAAQQRAVIRTACGILAATEGDLGTARGLHEEAWELVQPTGDGPRIVEAFNRGFRRGA